MDVRYNIQVSIMTLRNVSIGFFLLNALLLVVLLLSKPLGCGVGYFDNSYRTDVPCAVQIPLVSNLVQETLISFTLFLTISGFYLGLNLIPYVIIFTFAVKRLNQKTHTFIAFLLSLLSVVLWFSLLSLLK
jgi:hypothetical protein